MREHGTIKSVKERYLFIGRDNGERDVFAHISGFVSAQEFLDVKVGDRVTYTIMDAPKGIKAVGVERERK